MRCSPSIKSPSRVDKFTTSGRTSTSTFLQNDALQLQTIRVHAISKILDCKRLMSESSETDGALFLQVYSGSLNKTTAFANVNCLKSTTSAEVVQKVLDKFGISDHATDFQLAEVCRFSSLPLSHLIFYQRHFQVSTTSYNHISRFRLKRT